MNKNHTARSAFFNVRVVVSLCMVLAGVLLALLSFDRFSVQAQQKYGNTTRFIDPLVPALFDCSKIHELGIDKQESLRAGAIMIFCGEAQGGEPGEAPSSSAFSKLVQKLPAPMVYGGTDVDLITGTEIFPSPRHSLRLTRITPTRSSSAITTHEALRPRPPTVLARQSQPMVATHLPA
jgi:hypothetical protein